MRQQAILHAAITAKRETAAHPQAMRQLVLCAHAALLSSNVEMDDPQALNDVGRNLIREYGTAPPQTCTFIGVGAPQLSLAEVQGARQARSMELAGGLDGVALANLPKLPEAADELRGLAEVLGRDKSVLLLGAQASKPNVMALLEQGGEIVSFATHGFVASEITGVSDPSLLLAATDASTDPLQSLLTAREIADVDLDSRLVILSACNTATSDGRPRGASFTGLSQSFTSAGARSLLVSHWPVASMAATELSVSTVTSARDGKQELALALRDAMRKFRATYPEYSHPFYWAPFVFVGDGRLTLQ